MRIHSDVTNEAKRREWSGGKGRGAGRRLRRREALVCNCPRRIIASRVSIQAHPSPCNFCRPCACPSDGGALRAAALHRAAGGWSERRSLLAALLCSLSSSPPLSSHQPPCVPLMPLHYHVPLCPLDVVVASWSGVAHRHERGERQEKPTKSPAAKQRDDHNAVQSLCDCSDSAQQCHSTPCSAATLALDLSVARDRHHCTPHLLAVGVSDATSLSEHGGPSSIHVGGPSFQHSAGGPSGSEGRHQPAQQSSRCAHRRPPAHGATQQPVATISAAVAAPARAPRVRCCCACSRGACPSRSTAAMRQPQLQLSPQQLALSLPSPQSIACECGGE